MTRGKGGEPVKEGLEPRTLGLQRCQAPRRALSHCPPHSWSVYHGGTLCVPGLAELSPPHVKVQVTCQSARVLGPGLSCWTPMCSLLSRLQGTQCLLIRFRETFSPPSVPSSMKSFVKLQRHLCLKKGLLRNRVLFSVTPDGFL